MRAVQNVKVRILNTMIPFFLVQSEPYEEGEGLNA